MTPDSAPHDGDRAAHQAAADTARLSARTVTDFSEQWSRYTDNGGWYGSLEMFADILGPLACPDDFRARKVAEIGSGTGRIVAWLLAAGASEILAIEPASGAFESLEQNVQSMPGRERVRTVQASGAEWHADAPLDWVVSFGVVHHIPDPEPVMRAAWRALRPGGRCVVWLYGREGNAAYLALVQPLRAITTRLPHRALRVLVEMAYWSLAVYRQASRFLPLPLRNYLANVLWPMTPDKRRLVIYDQLNPAYARYYREHEARQLLITAGFTDVQTYHRHGYSWTVLGTKPDAADPPRDLP